MKIFILLIQIQMIFMLVGDIFALSPSSILGREKILKRYPDSPRLELTRDFVAEYNTTKCRDLIGCDLNTPEGEARFKEEKIMENTCAGCVKKAVQIVEKITA